MPKAKTQVRTRNFATVVYPESVPENWEDILTQQFVPAFISPLHDRDINPGGEVKKAHYHVMIMFDGVKTFEQAQSIFSLIGGVGCEVVQSIRGYARYLCHLDNPEKAQYNVDDVKSLCGADYTATIGLPTDKYKAVREMMSYCINNEVIYYCDLLIYAQEQRQDWFRVLCDSASYVMKEFLKSRDVKNRRTSHYDDFIRDCVASALSDALEKSGV